MSTLDAFESLFRSAVKDVFHLSPPSCEKVLVLSDGEDLTGEVRQLLSRIDSSERLQLTLETDWSQAPSPVMAAKELVEQRRPDLVVCRRHPGGRARNLPHTLGSVVDTLTQATEAPLLLMPPPGTSLPSATNRVMVVTDHLAGDDRLVNMGVQFTHRQGTLYLAHLEDEGMLGYYLEAISKMPELDSDVARNLLPKRLLKAPTDYIASVAEVLREADIEETIVPLVQMGTGVRTYQELMAEHEIDLLIVNSKDDRQDAMHAKAHAMAVQLRSRPLLLL